MGTWERGNEALTRQVHHGRENDVAADGGDTWLVRTGVQPSNKVTAGTLDFESLLPPLQARLKGRKCLVLDLDETLIHSSFKVLNQADFTIPLNIRGQYHDAYVVKRPGIDQFLKRMGELFEVVIFSEKASSYVNPIIDQLDIFQVVNHRLFRESCHWDYYQSEPDDDDDDDGLYFKDLSRLGRDLTSIIMLDNSPTSYRFHPQHAVPISSWFSDAHDNELLEIIPVLEDLADPHVTDVSVVLDIAC